MTATKIQPGDDLHLTSLMAPHSLNFVTGADRAALLAYGRDVFAAARGSKCLAQIEEPAQPVSPQGVPAGEIVLFGGDMKEVSWAGGKMPPPGTKLYAGAAPAAVAGPADELAELAMLNKLIELGAKASYAHAKSNSDDGPAGTAAYVQWQELRAEMGELIRAHVAPALEAPADPVAGEWQLVPTNPTVAMAKAYDNACFSDYFRSSGYKAMLAAAPQAQAHEAPAAPATPAQVQALHRARRALHAIGKTYDDSELRTRALEADEEIDRLLAAAPPAPAAAVRYVPVDSRLRDSNWRHPNDDELRTEACRAALRERGDDEGQGLDGYWKWGFAAGFNAATAAPAAPAVDAETVKKAARYDWLRGSNVANGTVLAEHFGGSRMQDFDAVIDAKIAARAAQAKEGGAAA